MLTLSPKIATNKLKEKLGKFIDTHSECDQLLSYQDQNGNFYARVSHKDTEWKVYESTNKDTHLTLIDTTKEYRPTKHSITVWINTSAGGKIYKELRAELKIDKELPEGPAECFEQLWANQPA